MASLRRNPLWLLLACIGMLAIAVEPATTCFCATSAAPRGATAPASPLMPCCAAQPSMHGACCKHQHPAQFHSKTNKPVANLHCSMGDSSHSSTHQCAFNTPDTPQWTQTPSGTLRVNVAALPLHPLSLGEPSKSCPLFFDNDERPPRQVAVPTSPGRAPPAA
ncbi:MAG: hypothetical protein JO316_08500 [Abitibacteriaceae bacterium]|nr:hypothetical protein [Abditibacteriaceae bacterium]